MPHREGIPLNDRGFRYGQHFFESVAIRSGKALLFPAHLGLLTASARKNGYPFPRSLASSLRGFVKNLFLPDGMLRLYLTAGSGAPASPIQRPGFFLTWEPCHFPTEEELRRGCRLTLLPSPFSGKGWGEKSGNYACHLEALASARAMGADEGIVFDASGSLLSCSMGNLLLWLPMGRGKDIMPCTPLPSRGARPGAVLDWIRKKIPVQDVDLRARDLHRAVAMAVTNSRLGVMPVALLDGKSLRDPSPSMDLARRYLKTHGLLRRP